LAPEVRLVALDLDGTLLNRQNRVSERDAAAVSEAVAAGVTVVLSTSRWHHSARRTALGLGIDGFIISHNGALVRSVDGGREVFHLRIEEALGREIAAHLDSVEGDGYVTVDDRTFVRSRRVRDPAHLGANVAITTSLAASLTAAPTAFLVFGKESVRSTVERFRCHHGKAINLAEGFSESYPDYLNIVRAGADKGSALAAVCEALDIPLRAALAIGDAAPDIAMIEVAGIGVAMGNAAPAVKAAATAVAPTNDNDGVAWAIRKYVLGG